MYTFINTGQDVNADESSYWQDVTTLSYTSSVVYFVLRDVNGDGLPDIVAIESRDSWSGYSTYYLSLAYMSANDLSYEQLNALTADLGYEPRLRETTFWLRADSYVAFGFG